MRKLKFYFAMTLILFCTTKAMARKPIFELKLLESVPSSGKTIAVGKLIDENGKQYFIGERGWTNIPKKFYVEKKSNVYQAGKHYQGITGEKYILSSMGETEIDGGLRSGLYVLISLKTNGVENDIEKLSTLKMAPGQLNPSWQFCKADKECVQVKNQCGNKIGVNSKYKKHYLDFLKTLNEKADCTKEVKAEQGSKCVEYFCS